jgi:serine/threonine protein kinase
VESPGAAFAKGPTAVLPVEPGRLVGGKYQLVRLLGGGSMGEVWVAEHRTLNEQVAVKLMTRGGDLDSLEATASAAARFKFEARTAARLSRSTKHIVRVTDHGEEGSLSYLVMELLEGMTLETMLLRQGPMTPERLVVVVRQIAHALDLAHADGVVHRDLKPANIFIARDEDGAPLVKLLDFGIARGVRASTDAAFSTAANVVLGTPGYMSPEHVSGAAPPDAHCDLWALATVAYEALTTELPLPGVHAEELIANLKERRFIPIDQRAADLPHALGAFFEQAFAPNVENRHQSAKELALSFERAVRRGAATKTQPLARVRSATATTVRRVRDTQVPAWLTMAGALGLVLLAGGYFLRRAPHTLAVTGASEEAPTSIAESPLPGTDVIKPSVAASVATPAATPAAGAAAMTGESARAAPSDLPATSTSTYAPSRDVAPVKAPRAKVDCTVPYEFDAQGTKRWKRDCF